MPELSITDSIRARTRDLRHDPIDIHRDRQAFKAAVRVEQNYARQLRQIGRHVGQLINAFDPNALFNDPNLNAQLRGALANYSMAITPWAEATGRRMLAEIARLDVKAWNYVSRTMSKHLRAEIFTAPTGQVMRANLARQVVLITSLPTRAAQRVHKLTTEAMITGERAAEVSKEIQRSGHVTESRANLIARTEVARSSSTLVEARARHVGAESYIWRSSEDSDVRPLHKKLNGTFHRWDEPPIAGEKGERAHPGCIYNCRCWPEPVLPDEIN